METNIKMMYGVHNDASRTVECATEDELTSKGYEYICGSEKGAYHIIFTRLSIDELKTPFALEIEKKAFGRSVGTVFHKYGDFVNERIEKLKTIKKESD